MSLYVINPYGVAPTFEEFATDLAPTHWWKMDEASGGLTDSGGGSAITLTANGGPTYSQTIGTFTAVDMDGVGDYFRSGTQPANDSTSFSVFMTCQPATLPAASNQYVLLQTVAAAGTAFSQGVLILLQANGSIYTMTALNGTTRQAVVTAGSLVSAGTPFTLGYSYDGAEIRVFVDGVEEASAAYSGGVNHEDTCIGHNNGAFSAALDDYDGKMCHVMVWDGSTISDSDHARLHTLSGV